MAATLTDHYVAAVTRHVSRKRRDAVDRDLRNEIAEDIDARVAGGEAPDRAEFGALTELGNPVRLAARYADPADVLIGPQTYPGYLRALGVLAATILPIVYVGQDIGYWVRGESVGAAIFGPVGTTLTTAMYLIVCVTVLFVLVDRVHRKGTEPARDWTPDELRPRRQRSPGAA